MTAFHLRLIQGIRPLRGCANVRYVANARVGCQGMVDQSSGAGHLDGLARA